MNDALVVMNVLCFCNNIIGFKAYHMTWCTDVKMKDKWSDCSCSKHRTVLCFERGFKGEEIEGRKKEDTMCETEQSPASAKVLDRAQ